MELDDAVEELESLQFSSRAFAGSIVRAAGGAFVIGARHSHGIRIWSGRLKKSCKVARIRGQQKLIPRKFEKVLVLPVPMRDSKLLLKLARLRLQSDPPPAADYKNDSFRGAGPRRAQRSADYFFPPRRSRKNWN